VKTVKARLEYLPGYFGLEKKELADIMGVTKQRLHGWETNNRVPDAKALIRLRERLGVNDVWVVKGPPAPMLLSDMTPDPFLTQMGTLFPLLTEAQKQRLVDSAQDSVDANHARPEQDGASAPQ
jgi:transcriptional regulator with XRE-family HTH domain